MAMQNMNDRVKVRGMNGAGFGIIQKSVMQNRELHVTAKAIYAYFSSFVGGGNSCFPSRSKICYDLDISKDTLTKYLNNLTNCGYLEIEQATEGGKFSHNVYTLCDPDWPPHKHENTVSENFRHGDATVGNRAHKKEISSFCQEITVSENSVSDNSVSDKLGTKNNSYKNNNYKNNSYINNNNNDHFSNFSKNDRISMNADKKENLDLKKNQVSDSAVNGKKLNSLDNKKASCINKKLLDQEFNQVWDLYPKKQGKKPAQAAFYRARRNGAPLESIISGIKSYLDYIAAKKISQEYVKQGSTFFNQEAWNDDWSVKSEAEARESYGITNEKYKFKPGYSFYNSKPNYDIEAYIQANKNMFDSLMDEEEANKKEFVEVEVDDYDQE